MLGPNAANSAPKSERFLVSPNICWASPPDFGSVLAISANILADVADVSTASVSNPFTDSAYSMIRGPNATSSSPKSDNLALSPRICCASPPEPGSVLAISASIFAAFADASTASPSIPFTSSEYSLI